MSEGSNISHNKPGAHSDRDTDGCDLSNLCISTGNAQSDNVGRQLAFCRYPLDLLPHSCLLVGIPLNYFHIDAFLSVSP